MNTRSIARGAVALTLVASLAAPAQALAQVLPGPTGTGPRAAVTSGSPEAGPTREQRLALLRARIREVLAFRKRVFDAAVTRIAARISRTSAIATKVEDAGGDVSGVRATLNKAKESLAAAKVEEAKAAALFRAVPDAVDKRAAFEAAWAQARVARQTLDRSRLQTRSAILQLRAVINGLRGAEQ